MSNAEKQPTGHGPEGCDENGPAAALLVSYVLIQIDALLAPFRRPILIATKPCYLQEGTLAHFHFELDVSRFSFFYLTTFPFHTISASSRLPRFGP